MQKERILLYYIQCTTLCLLGDASGSRTNVTAFPRIQHYDI